MKSKEMFKPILLVLLSLACDHVEQEPTTSPEQETVYRKVDDWCGAGLGGEASERTVAAGLARAHVGARLFGPNPDWLGRDNDLVVLMKRNGTFDYNLLRDYAELFSTVCAMNATPATEASTTVKLENGIAIITPGKDVPELPEDTVEIVVDLRAPAPNSPLKEIVALAFNETVAYGEERHKVFHGFPAQNEEWTHYENETVNRTLTLVGVGEKTLPLTFWTGPALTPAAARLVGGLRLHAKAAVVGYDVYARVAESSWTGSNAGGLLWRSAQLQMNGADWPDVISADLKTAVPDEIFTDYASLEPLEILGGSATRPPLADYDRALGEPTSALNRGTMRAALLVAYGTLDWFYPFFDLVGRDMDAALEVGLGEVSAASENDRKGMMQVLGRFMHSIHDGHGFYTDWGDDSWSDGFLDVQIQEIDDAPVVRVSFQEGIDPGIPSSLLTAPPQRIGTPKPLPVILLLRTVIDLSWPPMNSRRCLERRTSR